MRFRREWLLESRLLEADDGEENAEENAEADKKTEESSATPDPNYLFSKEAIKSLDTKYSTDEREAAFEEYWRTQVEEGAKSRGRATAKAVFEDNPEKLVSQYLKEGAYNKGAIGDKGKLSVPWIVALVASFRRFTGDRAYNISTNPFLSFIRMVPASVLQDETLDPAACAYIEQLVSKGKIKLNNEAQMSIFSDKRVFRYKDFRTIFDLFVEMTGEDGKHYWNGDELEAGVGGNGLTEDGIFNQMLNSDDRGAAELAARIRNSAARTRNSKAGGGAGRPISKNDEKEVSKMNNRVRIALNMLSDFQKLPEQERTDFLLNFATDSDDSEDLILGILSHWRAYTNGELKKEAEAEETNAATGAGKNAGNAGAANAQAPAAGNTNNGNANNGNTNA